MNDIAPNDTTIMQDVLISWATKERVAWATYPNRRTGKAGSG